MGWVYGIHGGKKNENQNFHWETNARGHLEDLGIDELH
jgi:hypothetical protein